MSWKIWIFETIVIFVISALIVSIYIFHTPQKQLVQSVTIPGPIRLTPPKLSYNISYPPQKGKVASIKKKNVSSTKKKKSNQKMTPFNMSTCNNNPNAPDFMEKKLRRANGYEDDNCAKINLNLLF